MERVKNIYSEFVLELPKRKNMHNKDEDISLNNFPITNIRSLYKT